MKNLILFFIFSLLLCSCKESKTKNNSSDSVAASHQQYSIEQFLNNTEKGLTVSEFKRFSLS